MIKAGSMVNLWWENAPFYILSKKGRNKPQQPFKLLFRKGDTCLIEKEADGSVKIERLENLHEEPQVSPGNILVYRREGEESFVVALWPNGEQPENATISHVNAFVCLQSKLENNQIDWYTEHTPRPLDQE